MSHAVENLLESEIQPSFQLILSHSFLGLKMIFYLLVIVVILFIYLWKIKTSKPRNFPPGPPRYPLPGAALTVRPVRLEPHQYFRFTNRGHFLKSPKNAIKINPKKCTPLEPHQYFRACDATACNIIVNFTWKCKIHYSSK